MNLTPLRYPGGKSVMASLIDEIISINSLKDVIYAEPYAGGAGAAIKLLLDNKVEAIRINDISIGIFSFWHYLINDFKKFLYFMETVEVNLNEWKKQKNVFLNSKVPSFELGFATFYLTRTNRSGILNAGPMGGNTNEKQELAKYKIDCRFNKNSLLNQFENIVKYKNRIKVTNYDALDFLNLLKGDSHLVYLDPPYYTKGKELYYNFYKHLDHFLLSEYLKKINNFKWLLSYDNVIEIQKLYSEFPLYEFNLTYTAQSVKKGSELFTHSENIILPKNPMLKRRANNIELLPLNLSL